MREIIGQIRRTLKRLDLTARSLFAIIEPGNAFAGTLFELALAADRIYMLDHPDEPQHDPAVGDERRRVSDEHRPVAACRCDFLASPSVCRTSLEHDGPFDAQEALDAGLVSFAPDDIDWEDEVRMAIEERTAFSPDALTGMEANLRFAGPETMETKIFGRLTAWQNWIFQRPNAVGERGALTVYGREGRPQFDWKTYSQAVSRSSSGSP